MTHEEMERKKRAILQSLAEGARAESAAPDEDDEEDGDIFVSTVTEAIALLLMHKEPGGARYRRRLIRFITDPKHQVYDSPNIYHNFVMHLFKLRDYIAALEVCDFVLRFAPQSRDILGDAIRACGESCQFERGERYLARAMEIPKELWCWRLFCYSVDFLKEKMIAYPADMAVAERAIALADEFVERFPYDEHGYNQRAEIDICLNRRDEAVAYLKHAILEVHPDERDSRSSLLAAQCCMTLLDILEDTNEYDFIIEICDRGLRSTAQTQRPPTPMCGTATMSTTMRRASSPASRPRCSPLSSTLPSP